MRAQTITTFAAAALALLAGTAPLDAQARGRADERLPKGYEPPRGMCRLWITGVPAAQQPAPTDCATAIRRRPENARVVFGEPSREGVDLRRDDIRRELRPERGAERAEPTPASRAREREAEPRTRTEPATRGGRPMPAQPPRSRRPPGSDHEELLAAEVALDLELLDALYSTAPPGGAHPRSADGRAASRTRVGERGRGRWAAPAERVLEWAVGPDGEPMSAWAIERLLRDELAYGAGYDGYDGYGAAYPYAVPPGALPGYGRVDARPGECFDRDFDGRCDALAGGADGCFDRNRDGRCDEARGYGNGAYDPRGDGRARAGAYGEGDAGSAYGLCFDRDRDGRCDEPWSADRRIPQTLPEMRAAVELQRGVASYDVERWLRRTDLQARVADRDGDGLPERVTWLDPSGRVVQSWTDRDGDGIADRVELYRDGLPVQVIGR